MTLEQMIGQVLDGIGEGGDGVASAATRSMVETQLRRAQTLVRQEANWTENRFSVDIPLAIGATTIDWPDDTGPGEIQRLTAQAASAPTDVWDLAGGITTDDRAAWLNLSASTSLQTPSKYDLRDGVIEVGPPSAEAITIRMEYLAGDDNLVDPGSRPRCDSTAVAMKAEMLVRNIRGGEFRAGIALILSEYTAYLERIKPKQGGAGGTIQPGRDWALLDSARSRGATGQRHWAYRNRRP